MQRPEPPDDDSDHLAVRPPLAPDEVAFVAGFARPGTGPPARTWPGQPAAASPWLPCADGCCLRLVAGTGPSVVAGPGPGLAAQWLRFLLGEFLAPGHRVTGRVGLRGPGGRVVAVLLAEGEEVFEGHVG